MSHKDQSGHRDDRRSFDGYVSLFRLTCGQDLGDLSGPDLSGPDLSGPDLSGPDLSG
ncbi:MAG: hypothetical protein AAGG48_27100 [Planctomycetota bacterium]